ncbi:MAG TPA: type II CAAX endopeptidase family protein [Candidatus Saccharimonadales bacterium]|nr:type II CAAX endopeptidase family protein [Candidatus Saccharimonadales bacterium]
MAVKQSGRSWRRAILLLLWALFAVLVGQIIAELGVYLGSLAGISLPLNPAVGLTILSSVAYLLTLLILIGVPWILKKRATTRKQLGFTGLPTWLDLGLGPAGYVIYAIIGNIVIKLIAALIPGFDDAQAQDIGFQNLSMQYEYIFAFITLVVVAPVAEEVVFRGYLYGRLRGHLPLWVAMVATSALFGLAHFQWNIAIDVFVLSMVACSLREVTGSIWAGILLHMIKNGIAFYFLFINPSFLVQ